MMKYHAKKTVEGWEEISAGKPSAGVNRQLGLTVQGVVRKGIARKFF
jgi:hypothetical protein